MTLDTQPELLTLGWLLNHRLVENVNDVESILVKWETDSVGVFTKRKVEGIEEKLKTKTVTTGCGQGAMYGDMMAGLNKLKLPQMKIKQSFLYDLLKN
jgi:FdhD protein